MSVEVYSITVLDELNDVEHSISHVSHADFFDEIGHSAPLVEVHQFDEFFISENLLLVGAQNRGTFDVTSLGNFTLQVVWLGLKLAVADLACCRDQLKVGTLFPCPIVRLALGRTKPMARVIAGTEKLLPTMLTIRVVCHV